MNDVNTCNHSVCINNRCSLEISGINDVCGFSETVVEAEYKDGNIAVEGSDLKIVDFSSQSGILKIVGMINAVYYYGTSNKKRKGFLRK